MVERTRNGNYKIYSEKDKATFYYKKSSVEKGIKFYGWKNLSEIWNPAVFIYECIPYFRIVKD